MNLYESVKKSLKEAEETNSFKYNGFTFTPVGNVRSNASTVNLISTNFKNIDRLNRNYNYREFYNTAPEYDLFKVKEFGDIIVIPGTNSFFRFNGSDSDYIPVGEVKSREELGTADSLGYMGDEYDKEIVDDILSDTEYGDIAYKLGWALNKYQLYNLADLYVNNADVRGKIEDLLTDINYHSDCSELAEDPVKFRDKLKAELSTGLKEAEEGNLNVNKIADFVEKAVNDLQTTDYTCSRYILDDDLAIYVGWSAGYGDEPRDDVIQDKNNPDYGINVGIKVRNDYDWTDFDYLNFPIYNDDSGEIWDAAKTLSPDDDYKKTAKWLIDEYKDIKKAVEKGEVLLESCKGKKHKKKLKEAEEENAVLKTFMNKYKPLYDTKPVMKGDTLYADQVSFRGSGIPKRVEAELRPDNTMEVGNEEWGFKYDGSAIDENSMENMSQYWFYDDYRSNEDTKAKIDKAAKSLYDDMVKLRDSFGYTPEVKEETPTDSTGDKYTLDLTVNGRKIKSSQLTKEEIKDIINYISSKEPGVFD